MTRVTLTDRPGSFPLVRWIAFCAAAEAVGMSASAAAARASDFAPGLAGGILSLLLIVGGGLVEGFALGSLQSIVLKGWLPELSRRRWILLTTLVAGVGWAAASAPSQLSASDSTGDSTPPIALIVVGAAALGAVMGALLGAAQAGGLRHLVRNPWRWIGISTVAWAPTMTIIFVGATTPEADWSYPQVILLGTATGALAGAVLGLVSGLLAPSLDGHSTTNRLVALLLRSRALNLLGESLVVLRIRGHVSGTQFELPVQYARTPSGLVVVPGHPERKQWWRNLTQPSAIEVLIHGTWRPAMALVLSASEKRYTTALAAYDHRWPKVRVPDGGPLVLVTWAHSPDRQGTHMARGESRRRMYAGGRPNRTARFLNDISARMFSLGFSPHWAVTLETVSPKSGKSGTLPLVIARNDHREYLVSMLGQGSRWVRDVRAAGGHAIIHSGRRRPVLLEEVAAENRAPILKAYLARAPGARAHIPVDRREPVAKFERIAADYPVFEIHYLG